MRKWHIVAFGLSLAFVGVPDGGAQSVPPLINYQGRLTDQSGAPLAPGPYVIQFKLWDDALLTNATDLIWGQQQTVTLQTNGVFNVILGSPGGSSIPGVTPAVNSLGYAFAGSNCFLGVTVAAQNGANVPSPSEIAPRQQLLSVPFSVAAQQAQQAQVAAALAPTAARQLAPPGSIVAYMGTSAPSGWLLCDGSLVSRTQYAALFSVIGTASGSGDGATTFNLPDLRGMFLRGVNGSQGNTNIWDPDAGLRTNEFAGGNSGNAVGSMQTDQFRGHTHSFTSTGYQGCTPSSNPSDIAYPSNYSPNGVTGPAGGNETRPKNVYVNYIVKY